MYGMCGDGWLDGKMGGGRGKKSDMWSRVSRVSEWVSRVSVGVMSDIDGDYAKLLMLQMHNHLFRRYCSRTFDRSLLRTFASLF